MQWVKAAKLEELQEKRRVLYREDNKQIAIFWSNDNVYALDNRCPHQGYPLKEGTVSDGSCVLTCQWHNWKFKMDTGECIQGADHVRTYPTRQEDGFVWLNIQEPSAEDKLQDILKGFKTAVEKRQYGRISREIARIKLAGLDPLIAIQKALEWSHQQFEYGTTHAYAVLADWLELYQKEENFEIQLTYLSEAVDHISFDALRHPEYTFPKGELPFEGEAFLQAIEEEDQTRAIPMLRGALASGMGWEELEIWFARAALAHYNDFGHSLIYVQKVTPVLKALGAECLEYLLLPLTRSLCVTTREDLLPEFKKYRGVLESIQETPILNTSGIQSSQEELRLEELFDASVNKALAWVKEQIPHTPVRQMYTALLEAAARNLLHYDTSYQNAYDKPVAQNIGWLHCTHALTFANALHTLANKHPELWLEGLLQMACFAGRNRKYTQPNLDKSVHSVEKPGDFFRDSLEHIQDHGVIAPIYSSHLIKTYCSVKEEYQLLDTSKSPEASCGKMLLASLNRFLYSPIKQKHVRRTARQSLTLLKGA